MFFLVWYLILVDSLESKNPLYFRSHRNLFFYVFNPSHNVREIYVLRGNIYQVSGSKTSWIFTILPKISSYLLYVKILLEVVPWRCWCCCCCWIMWSQYCCCMLCCLSMLFWIKLDIRSTNQNKYQRFVCYYCLYYCLPIGTGKTTVLLFSAEMLFKVWRYRSWNKNIWSVFFPLAAQKKEPDVSFTLKNTQYDPAIWSIWMLLGPWEPAHKELLVYINPWFAAKYALSIN